MHSTDASHRKPTEPTSQTRSPRQPGNKRRAALLAALRDANTNPPEPVKLEAPVHGPALTNELAPDVNVHGDLDLAARKKSLRKVMRARRKALAGRPDGSASAEAVWQLMQRFSAQTIGGQDPAAATSLIAYEALPGELSLARFLASTNARIWLPVVASAGGRPLSELPVGFIREDEPATLRIACSLVIVPALAVDEGGARLGQGGGWYDRALPKVMAASPDALIFAATPSNAYLHSGVIPMEEHDMLVDGVVTDTGWRVF